MGKGQRNRAASSQRPPRTGADASTVFPSFPYERKFTKEEIHGDILPRAKRLGDAMRDGVGPSGHVLYIPGDIFELWMIHAALAGCDVDEAKAYIRARPRPGAAFEDAVEWILKAEDTEAMRQADAEAEADRYLAAMDENLRPEVRDALRRRLRAAAAEAAEYLADDPDAETKRAEPQAFGPPLLVQVKPDQEVPPE